MKIPWGWGLGGEPRPTLTGYFFPPLDSGATAITTTIASTSTRARMARKSNPDKQAAVQATNAWMDTHCRETEGSHVPHRDLYAAYESSRPVPFAVSSVTFGRLLKRKYSGLTSKRLGPRGHSIYYYANMSLVDASVEAARCLTKLASRSPPSKED